MPRLMSRVSHGEDIERYQAGPGMVLGETLCHDDVYHRMVYKRVFVSVVMLRMKSCPEKGNNHENTNSHGLSGNQSARGDGNQSLRQ